MSAPFASLTFSRLAGVLAALWLCGVGAAWAGDGADLASLNQLLNTPTTGLCAILGMKTCPQLPTVTQAILEVAGLGNSPPEIIGAQNSITPGSNVIAGNPAAVPPSDSMGNALPVTFPLNSQSTPTLQNQLSTLTPLAFVSQTSGTGRATQLYDPKADTFLYAVGVSSLGAIGVGGLTNADTVYFFYDDLSRVTPAYTNGQIVAKFSFPLTVLNNNGTENPPVMTTLAITSCANGLASCFKANAIGDFLNTGRPQTVSADKLGIQFALVFSASPTSTQKHTIFEVAVPLVVTGAYPTDVYSPFTAPLSTDPAHFYSALTGDTGPRDLGTYTAFGDAGDDLGYMSPAGILPASAYSIGLAPTAAPFCTATTCPSGNPPPPPPPGSVPFALCAALPDNTTGPGAHLRPAVGAYYAIATDGEMFLGAPVPSVYSACPAL